MARGRKPEPEAVRAQKAPVRSRQRPRPDYAAAARPTPVKPAAWLTADGRRIWQRLAPRLTQSRLLSLTDSETFARYCFNFARWLGLQKELAAKGMTYTVQTASGEVHRARPEFMMAERVERHLLAAEDRFGLNPAERQRIFAARAQHGAPGDLFDQPDDPKAVPTKPAQPVEDESPIGYLTRH